MQKLIVLFFTILLTISGISQKNETTVYLNLTVQNAGSDSIRFEDFNSLSTRYILLDKDHADTSIAISEGFYYLGGKDYSFKLYLSPGDRSWISLDEKNIDSTLKIEGKKAEFTNYWIEKGKLDRSILRQRFMLLDETAFLSKIDSAEAVRLSLLEKYSPHFSQKEVEIAREQIKYQKIFSLTRYPGIHSFYTKNDSFEVSDNYPDAFKEIDPNNKIASVHFEYINALIKLVYKAASQRIISGDTMDRALIYIQSIDSLVSNPKVKSELTFTLIKRFLTKSKRPDEMIEMARQSVNDSFKLDYLEQKYKKVVLTKAGNPSPTFTFINRSGKEVSLEDFRGQVVYIDIWASWCAPCIAEIPSFKKLQDTLKNEAIAFVSISYSDDQERWQKVLSDKNLGGVQLFSKNSNHAFFENYSVSGIPRYILLDQNLRIVAANADRPSNPQLQKQIRELLKKSK